MDLQQTEKLKTEYTKPKFKIKDIPFEIKKIPAFQAIGFFNDFLARVAKHDIKLTGFKSDVEAVGGIISAVLQALDREYLENTVMPKLFDYMTFEKTAAGVTQPYNLNDHKDMIEDVLGFDDVYELIIRGLCVNFLGAFIERLQKFVPEMHHSKPAKPLTSTPH